MSEAVDWTKVEALQKCQRCGGKADNAYIKTKSDKPPSPTDWFEILAVVCKPCEQIYNAEILNMAAMFRGPNHHCEDCDKPSSEEVRKTDSFANSKGSD